MSKPKSYINQNWNGSFDDPYYSLGYSRPLGRYWHGSTSGRRTSAATFKKVSSPSFWLDYSSFSLDFPSLSDNDHLFYIICGVTLMLCYIIDGIYCAFSHLSIQVWSGAYSHIYFWYIQVFTHVIGQVISIFPMFEVPIWKTAFWCILCLIVTVRGRISYALSRLRRLFIHGVSCIFCSLGTHTSIVILCVL
jgi:hypothetical protein